MRYVKRYVDRTGAERLYFRKAGHPQNGAALKSAWPEVIEGSALQREVEALLGQQANSPKPQNLAGAVRAYELGADFRVLSDATKYEYRLILREFEAVYGALPVAAFTPSRIFQMRDVWSDRGHRAANVRLQLLKNVLSPQLIARDIPDPFSRIKQVRRPRDLVEPHPIWPEAVVECVIKAAIEQRRFGLARAVAIARYAGARRGDLVRMTHSARKAGRIAWLSGKRLVPVDIEEDAQLTRWLAATPAEQPKSKWQRHIERTKGVVSTPAGRLVFNMRNRPYTEDGLGQELAKLVADLHAQGALQSDAYDLHGLRHTFGVELALAGLSEAQGAAMMGHGSPHSFATYRRQAARLNLSNEGAERLAAYRNRRAGTAGEPEMSNGGLKVSNAPAPIIAFRSGNR